MPQPTWITPAGSLGTIPEGIFYKVPVQAVAEGEDVYFRLIAGELPDGIQVTTDGSLEGTPKSKINVQGTPVEVSSDVTSKFAIRAYTVKTVGNQTLIDRLADRTFSITVSGQDAPEFITPPGNVGTFYDGTKVSVKIDFIDRDPDDVATVRLISGQLPPGLELNKKTGLISGVIFPLVGPPGTADPGYDDTAFSQYPFDFGSKAASKNFQFTLELSDGKSTSIRAFEIYVYAKSTMVADTTTITSDDTFPTADVTPDHVPVLLNPGGNLGTIRADNWYFYKFTAIDFDGDAIEYVISSGKPPGLSLDPTTGWLYGYIPDQGFTQATYSFNIRVKTVQPNIPWDPLTTYVAGSIVTFLGDDYVALATVPASTSPLDTSYWALQQEIISEPTYFTITIIGNIETEVSWITDPDLGTINNGAVSTLSVQAVDISGRDLQYRLVSGSDSPLPQGLTLQPSGHITGCVSFNTFALDGGYTTFDVNLNPRLDIDATTFDSTFTFTVNAFAPQTVNPAYSLADITILNGGTGYVSAPTVTISAPPDTAGSIQAVAHIEPTDIVSGSIVKITIDNPGAGYITFPMITISGGGGIDAAASPQMIETSRSNAISIFRTFTIKVLRAFNEPYQTLYIKCMPPQNDRDLIQQLLLNQDIFPQNLLYRPDDPNFGVARNVIYNHAYGLAPRSTEDYVRSLDINHYWKNITLGELRTARALDSNGDVLYEVVYSTIVDDLVNDNGVSVGKSVTLPYPVYLPDTTKVTTVYPNSLDDMRNQVIDSIGQISPALPLWMTSKQSDGRVLGFTPAWVIAYTQPGQSKRVAYSIQEQFDQRLNQIDFQIDRYEIDRSQTYDWDPSLIDQYHPYGRWIPQPPVATTFDLNQRPFEYVGWTNNTSQIITWTNNQGDPVLWHNDAGGGAGLPTIFDGGSTRFITPANRWLNSDVADKYLLFPRRNILQFLPEE